MKILNSHQQFTMSSPERSNNSWNLVGVATFSAPSEADAIKYCEQRDIPGKSIPSKAFGGCVLTTGSLGAFGPTDLRVLWRGSQVPKEFSL